MIVGHEAVRQVLEFELPAVALLSGPASIGKWTLVRHLAEHHRVAFADRLLINEPLTVNNVRYIIHFTGYAPFGQFKYVAARLDDASEQALNALLKTLEEPPRTARFIVTTASTALPTIASRCQIFRMGLLSDTELASILVKQGMTPVAAALAAKLGRGQVARAKTADVSDGARATVVAVFKALATNDAALFDQAFANFDDTCRALLMICLHEGLSHRWSVFSEADLFGLHRKPESLWRLVAALSQHPEAQSRLGVRAALESFVTHR